MADFYQMYTIFNKSRLVEFTKFYEKHNLKNCTISIGYGTAVSETLHYLGLDKQEKVIISSIITKDTWNDVKPSLQDDMAIDLPGNGISFIVPLSSVGGRAQLEYLCDGQEIKFTEEAVLKDTQYELLTIVTNVGHTDTVMDAAKKAGARGGTVVHAKGTGAGGSSKFFGVSLANEKEIIYIVVKRENKNEIMQMIMDEAGIDTPAQSIVYSLPVTSTAGIRFGKPSETSGEQSSEEGTK